MSNPITERKLEKKKVVQNTRKRGFKASLVSFYFCTGLLARLTTNLYVWWTYSLFYRSFRHVWLVTCHASFSPIIHLSCQETEVRHVWQAKCENQTCFMSASLIPTGPFSACLFVCGHFLFFSIMGHFFLFVGPCKVSLLVLGC